MLSETEKRIIQSRSFQLLLSKRRRLRWALVLLSVGSYVGFNLAAVYAPSLLSYQLSENSVVTLGIALAYVIMLLGIVLSAYYVHKANTGFARLEDEVLRELDE